MQGMSDFLEGAVDVQVHSAPDMDVRRFNDIGLAREAARARMGAILVTSHQNSTVERAWLVSRVVPEIRVVGGLVRNETVGGLNPAAVRLAVSMGAKQVCFVPFETMEQAIAETGVENTVLSTDLGQPDTPPPAEGLRLYAARLRSTGFSLDDIRRMMRCNPASLLGMEGACNARRMFIAPGDETNE